MFNLNVYREVQVYAKGPLMKVINSVFRKIRNRDDISDETYNYLLNYLLNNSKLRRFYSLPKIHKILHSVPGRLVISNSSFANLLKSHFGMGVLL